MSDHPFPPRLVRASAGSGKTYQLIHRFIGLLAAGVEPRRILATTFTRKAAGEILARVMRRLAGAVLDEKLRAQVNEEIPREFALDAEAADRLLAAVARALPDLQVETLDAFFHRIAAGHAFELQLPPDWGIGDAATLARLRRSAVADLLEADANAAVELVRRLSKGDLRRSVTEQVDDLVVDLHHRWLESPGPSWDRIPLPPAPSAADLVRARGAIADAPVPLTAKGEEPKHWRDAREAILRALDEDEPQRLAGIGLVQKILDGELRFSSKEIPVEWSEALAAPLAAARHWELSRLIGQNHASRELMGKYDECERHRRDEVGLYDFGTVTRRLVECRATEQLLSAYERLDTRIDHVLLDEFQDTSRFQYWVLKPVFDEVIIEDGSRTFFCVGDVKQAIYGWRGGCRALFDAVEELLPDNSATLLDLSRRSSPIVLDAVNEVFGGVADTMLLPGDADTASRWAEDFHEHSAASPDLSGYVELRIAEREERDGDLSDRDLPYLRAIDVIRQIHEAAPSATVGVLLRRNDRIVQLIDLLRAEGIDASQEGGNPLSDSPAVNRILSALLFADHPGDRASLYAVVGSPLGGHLGLAGTDDRGANGSVARQLRRDLLTEGYGVTLRRLATAIAPAVGDRDRARLDQLIELAHRFGDETGLRPGTFVERVRRTPVESPTASPVRVMTIHGAKGLEFDAVVVPQLTDSWFTPTPTVLAAGDDPIAPPDRLTRYASKDLRRLCSEQLGEIYQKHRAEVITESLSVLYVAMTRPRHALHLILPPGRLNEAPTFARILRLTLGGANAEETGAGEMVLYSSGDPEWARHLSGPTETPATTHPSPRREGGGVAIVSAAPLPSARPRDGAADGGVPASVRTARRFGTVVHQLLEGIEWLDEARLSAQLAEVLDAAAASVPVLALPLLPAAREMVERLLTAPDARAFFSREESARRLAALAGAEPIRVEVARELPYAIETPAGLSRGTIDRLHIAWGEDGPIAAEVIDAKTDGGGAGEAGTRALREKYAAQLEAYQSAVTQLYGIPPERIALSILHAATASSSLTP